MSTRSLDEMMAAVADSLRARIGRTLDEWLAIVRADGPDSLDQAVVRSWLKTEHGIAQKTQWAIADAAARVRRRTASHSRRRQRSTTRLSVSCASPMCRTAEA